MEVSNEFNNKKMKNKEHIICVNDEIEVNQIMQKIK
jgi:hypothetical protein